MKRSKAFFKAVFTANRERMLATFDRAKKHTQEIVQRNQKRDEKSLLIILWHIYSQKTRTVLYTTYKKSRSHIDRFLARDTYADLSVFFEKTYGRIKDVFIDAYSKFILRGEYTRRTLIMLFLVAIIIGIGVKSVAVKSGVTMGFEDYTVISNHARYDIGLLQKKSMDQEEAPSENNERQGDVCSDLDI